MNIDCILLIYGSGGHNEQMKRFYENIIKLGKNKKIQYISLCDDNVKNIITDKYYLVSSVTDKFSYIKLLLKLPLKIIFMFKILNKIKNENSLSFIISTGPGLAIVSSLYFKVFTKVKIIHIETWSRFYSKSLTGRFMYFISDEFFVQNKELLKIYPNAKYKGRL